MAWEPTDDLVPSEILDSAVDDTRERRFEDALQKFLWFHEASRTELGMGGVRLSFALGYWMDLASEYPLAMDAFIQVRDEAEKRCRANAGDFESFHDVSALNRYLDDDRRTIALFLEIARDAPENAKRIYHVAEHLLAAEGMYRECAPFLEWETRLANSIKSYELDLQHEKSYEVLEQHPPKFARRHFQIDVATLVALLVLNDRKQEAEEVCRRCLDVLNDDEMRSVLDAAREGQIPAR